MWIRRISFTCFMVLFVLTFNFFLFRMMPSDPMAMISKEISSEQAYENLKKQYGLDKPLLEQFFIYMRSMFRFDFGVSFQYNQPVKDILKEKIKNSLLLALFSVPFGILIGLFFGALAAVNRNNYKDALISSISMIIYAIPSFWFAMILLMIFGVKLRWVPINGMLTPGVDYQNKWMYYQDLIRHLIVPSIAYALTIFGSYFMVMRSSVVEVLDEDYVLTAQAKGLSPTTVIYRHVIPNALLPVTTIVVMSIALMFTGAFSIEVLFSWPGMGRLMIDAVQRQDYPILQAVNFIIAMMVVFANLIIDILYSYIDPRVRLN